MAIPRKPSSAGMCTGKTDGGDRLLGFEFTDIERRGGIFGKCRDSDKVYQAPELRYEPANRVS